MFNDVKDMTLSARSQIVRKDQLVLGQGSNKIAYCKAMNKLGQGNVKVANWKSIISKGLDQGYFTIEYCKEF